MKFRYLVLAVLALLVMPATALADVANHESTKLVLPADQIWTLAIGGLVPLVTYVLNHAAPWTSEAVKAAVLVVASAVAGALYKALANGDIGFNAPTLQYVLTAVVAALVAHHWLWKPSTISTRLGAGSNA
jgi:hypothetical protein